MSAQRAVQLGIDPRVAHLFLELSRPSAEVLALAAQERGIPLSRANARALVLTDNATQEFAPPPKFGGKIVASQINQRWAADLMDQKAKRGRNGETAILIVQDIFSRRIFAKALLTKRAEEVAAAFQTFVNEEGRPGELVTDGGLEFTGVFNLLLRGMWIPHVVKPVGEAYKNGIATLDAAIRRVRDALGRINAGSNWPTELASVTREFNQAPHSAALQQKPASVPFNEEIQFALKQKAARDTRASVENTSGLLEAMRGAEYARELVAMGPFPRRRAGVAIWGPRIPVISIEGGQMTLANGSSGPTKAFKPAPYDPPV